MVAETKVLEKRRNRPYEVTLEKWRGERWVSPLQGTPGLLPLRFHPPTRTAVVVGVACS